MVRIIRLGGYVRHPHITERSVRHYLQESNNTEGDKP